MKRYRSVFLSPALRVMAFVCSAILLAGLACVAPKQNTDTPAEGGSDGANQETGTTETTTTTTSEGGGEGAATAGAQEESAEPPSVEALVGADRPLEDNLLAARQLLREVMNRFGSTVLAENDPRRQEELYTRLEVARQTLLELYAVKVGTAEEHGQLCQGLAALGPEFQPAVLFHCSAYVDAEGVDTSTEDYARALLLLGEFSFRDEAYDAAEDAFRKYLQLYCPAGKTDRSDPKMRYCGRVLTQNLPRIYHATANINKLEETLAQCWDHQLVRDSELLTLRRFLLEDYWLNDNRAALAKLAKDVLEQARWGKKTSHTQRQLAAPALSALARVKLLEGDCFAARQVYLDYEFENPEIDESWLGDNITIPSRLLCRPAPGLPPATWVHGDAPASKPGRVTLLQFLDPASSPSMTTIEPANELVKAAGEKVQVVTLFPLAARLVDPVEQTIHSALEENDFRAKLEAVATGMKVQHPWGVLEGGRGDPALAAYGVNRYPTLVLIQPDGTVAAYHPFSSFDRGWQVLVEHLPAAQ